jgi:hypothetical protein
MDVIFIVASNVFVELNVCDAVHVPVAFLIAIELRSTTTEEVWIVAIPVMFGRMKLAEEIVVYAPVPCVEKASTVPAPPPPELLSSDQVSVPAPSFFSTCPFEPWAAG